MEDISEYSPAIVLCDDMLEVFVVKGFRRSKGGIRGGLGKCSGQENVGL